ncbi:hypothetical protein ABL78_5023 [Leptomonas seymouri]|uniref:DUF2062 domain-containing protein n=1 Tax=Leptomonas seymouri TaxID=5684 RepID=A0A0N1PCS7_LEPSE|nr:hypothetical protein ABL78_5023 [Leptomonas seymouri]|eukprot:KPI85891.1 hypothetical protein ABL78_5023 [Leptomonas seymouri]
MQRCRQRAFQVLRERLLNPLRQLTGIEIFVAVAVGVVGGVFPVPLITSLVTLISGWYIHCSAAELVVGSTVNLLCTPLQFAFLPSFARLSGTISQADTSAFTATALMEALTKGYAVLIASCARMIAYAVFGWLLVCIPVIFVLRALQRCAVRRELQRQSLHLLTLEEVHVSIGH